jgi:hypothetical protein
MGTPNFINFPFIADERGNLSFLEGGKHIPFEIKRVFWLYDIPGKTKRGGHAFYNQEEVIISLSGSFDVVVTNKNGKSEVYHLNDPSKGLYLPKNTWRHMESFSTNGCALHISSLEYSPSEYIRDFNQYQLL